ncbi:MAG TPA: MFS transporter [Streptosporangiaceae bacterium]|jgi:CP family cyanate transporter-like MFS transporter
MAKNLARGAPARRRLEAALLVVSIAALAVNLRAAITSLPPVFPELETRLRLSSAAVTVLATTPVVCFGLVSGTGAWLSRRLGEERVLFGALIALSAGLLLRGAWPAVMLFPGTILATGAIALMNVLLSSMIKRRWPGRAGLLIGIYLTGLSVGAVLAALFSVPLYNSSGGSVRLTLGLWALPAIAATLVWISQARYGAAARRATGPAAPPAGPAAAVPPRARARVAVHRHALAWQVTGFMGLQSLLYYAAVSWLPELFRDRGASAGTAGTLAAVMAFGGLITSLSTPVLAQRVSDQRLLVAPAVIVTALGLLGALYAPLGSEIIWMLVLGAAQGAALGLAIFFTMARAPDPGTAASLSSLAQAVGYLVAAAGPLAVGFLHTATGGWTVPIMVLLVICVAEIITGLLAGRAKILPAAGVPGNPDSVGAVPAEH